MSIVAPFKITRSPNGVTRLRMEMAMPFAAPSFPVAILVPACVVKDRREDHVGDNNAEDRLYDRGGCGASNALRSTMYAEAFETAYLRDNHGKHDALDQTGDDVARHQGVHRSQQVVRKAPTEVGHGEEGPAEHTGQVRDRG